MLHSFTLVAVTIIAHMNHTAFFSQQRFSLPAVTSEFFGEYPLPHSVWYQALILIFLWVTTALCRSVNSRCIPIITTVRCFIQPRHAQQIALFISPGTNERRRGDGRFAATNILFILSTGTEFYPEKHYMSPFINGKTQWKQFKHTN